MSVKRMKQKLSRQEKIDLYSKGVFHAKEGTKTIEEEAFYGCLELRKLIIPASVKSIRKDAFRMCVNLRKIVFEGMVPSYVVGAFDGCDQIEEVEFTSNGSISQTEDYSRMVKQFLQVKGKVIAHCPNCEEREVE